MSIPIHDNSGSQPTTVTSSQSSVTDQGERRLDPRLTGHDKGGRSVERITTSSLTQLEALGASQEAVHQKKSHSMSTAAKIALVVASPILVALALVAVPLVLIGIGLNTAYVSLKKKIKTTVSPNSLSTAITTMKTKEQADKLQTIKNIVQENKYQTFARPEAVDIYFKDNNIGGKINSHETLHKKLESSILRNLENPQDFSKWKEALENPAIKDALKKVFLNPTQPKGSLAKAVNVIKSTLSTADKDLHLKDEVWSKITQEVSQDLVRYKKIDREVEAFKDGLKEFALILSTPGNPAEINPKMIKKLRELLRSPVYQNLKHTDDLAVQFLHRCASDMWNKAPALSAYEKLGETIYNKTMKRTEKNPNEKARTGTIGPSGPQTAAILKESMGMMKKRYFTDHGIAGKIDYGTSHVEQSLGSAASEGGNPRKLAKIFNKDVYDSHGTLANNPSLQGQTVFKLSDSQGNTNQATVNNCYGGSPTIGDHEIAPEFEAVLQAAENQQLAKIYERDPEIPMLVNYNNLQNLDKRHGEGPRSLTIMELNEKYPLSFTGSTFSKDSSMYMMPHDIDVTYETPIQFAGKMKSQLLKSFEKDAQGLVATGHGFYFHGPQETWEPVFDAVVDKSADHFSKTNQFKKMEECTRKLKELNDVAWSDPVKVKQQEQTKLKLENEIKHLQKLLQGAQQEYVYSMLMAVLEAKAAKTLVDRGVENPTVMVVSACKENIDRGGMENTKGMYLKLPLQDELRTPILVGILHSRALSARDRDILPARTPQALDFMETTEPEDFNKDLAELLKTLGYQISETRFKPALDEPNALDNPPALEQSDVTLPRLSLGEKIEGSFKLKMKYSDPKQEDHV